MISNSKVSQWKEAVLKDPMPHDPSVFIVKPSEEPVVGLCCKTNTDNKLLHLSQRAQKSENLGQRSLTKTLSIVSE